MTARLTIGYGADIPPDLISLLVDAHPAIALVPLDDLAPFEHLDAVISWHIDAAFLERCPKLQWIQSIAAGVDRMALSQIGERGIVLTNTSGLHAINIAEHVLAMMLAHARNLPAFIRAQQSQEWLHDAGRDQIFELSQQSILIVGFGAIGQALSSRANALGMNVSAVRRNASDPSIVDNVTVYPSSQLSAQLAVADQVAVTLPLTSETEALFDDEMFAAMKTGAFFYNIGRGPVVDTDALLRAVQSGHLGGAGLDVTEPEPLPSDHPLWREPNVIITPHLSGATPRYAERGAAIISENLRRFTSGERPMLNEVNLQLGY